MFLFQDALIKRGNEMGESRIMAIAKAAYLVIESLRRRIPSALRKPDLVRKFIVHLKGFYWSRAMLSKLGRKPSNDITQCITSPDLPLDEIGKLRQMFKAAYFDQSMTIPSNWEAWVNLITRRHIYEVFAFAEWSQIIDNLSSLRIPPSFRPIGFY